MSEEDSASQLSARTAAGEESTGEENERAHPKRSPKQMSHNKPYLAHSRDHRGREAELQRLSESQRLSDLQNVPRGMLDRTLQAQLGRQLRAIFSDVAQEPVPDRFVKLLEALEAREKRR